MGRAWRRRESPVTLTIERSPWTYRNLLDAAWTALHQTGHAGTRSCSGRSPRVAVPPRTRAPVGVFNGMTPLQFLRALYCVDTRYRPLRGRGGAPRLPDEGGRLTCVPQPAPGAVLRHRFRRPSRTRAGIRRTSRRTPSPDYDHARPDRHSSTRALDRVQRVYGAHPHFPIWNTEYGYITSPPKRPTKRAPYIKQSTAAYYMNWAEYISWRNPRIRSYMQYLLDDAAPRERRYVRRLRERPG